ncbi:MAG: hypothetical protein NXH72_14035 [Hyphomonadaceae bacterium]|nr:hypothetical protein [Hyphomonadaceae bacterium]
MIRMFIVWGARLGLLGLTGFFTVAALNTDAFGINELVKRHPDKIVHIAAAFLFSLLSILALPGFKAWKVLAGMLALSVIAELVQVFGGRSAHLSDLAMSWLGVAAFAIAYYCSRVKRTIASD